MSSLKSFLHGLRMHPLRGTLILLTITVGVATLSVTTGLSTDIRSGLDSALAVQGRRIVIANGELDGTGRLRMQSPARFTPEVSGILAADYEKLSDITTVASAWVGSTVMAGGRSWRVRSAVQATETYAELMNLTMAAGRFFDASEVESRNRVLVMSSLAGRMLFGSTPSAVGQTVSLAGKDGVHPYTVVGVYGDVPDVERRAYGIGDFILPILSGVPVGLKVHPVQFGAVLMARIATDTVEKAESRIRSILEPAYGNDLELSVWEGLPDGPAPLIEESRRSVASFAKAVGILGFIILATSSNGIFSVMLVEALGRTREIGLRRALGTTRAGIRRFFLGQALLYSFFGSVIGVGLAVGLYRTVGAFLAPLFDSAGLRAGDLALTVPGPLPIAVAVGSALLFGGLFGFFPAVSASRTPIVECIREDTA